MIISFTPSSFFLTQFTGIFTARINCHRAGRRAKRGRREKEEGGKREEGRGEGEREGEKGGRKEGGNE